MLIDDLPEGGHSTRPTLIGPDGKMYVSVGSSCNVCEEDDNRRAAVVRYNLDGSGEEVFAEGLRNSVGLAFHLNPETMQFELWSVDNGRDLIGDELPPEEVNILTKGKHYGWPYCYGQQIANPEYPDHTDYCKQTTISPIYEMQAHSAPLGITFPTNLAGEQIGELTRILRDKAIITFHGSWNRTTPTGYKVVTVDTTQPGTREQDLITGWLLPDGTTWGRPVDVKFSPAGDMYVTDDAAGVIYRITAK